MRLGNLSARAPRRAARTSLTSKHSSRTLCAAALALALGACGGGGGSEPPVEPPLARAWSEVQPWPLIAIHAVLTPGGNVLSYGSDAAGRRTGRFIYDVWDPTRGSAGHTTLQNVTTTDIFCSAQIVLPQGDVLIAGGDKFDEASGESFEQGNQDATLFEPSSNTLKSAGQMQRPRWYATITSLPSGEHYIQGGIGFDETDALGGFRRPELRKADGSFQALELPTGGLSYSYPRNFVTPDGRIFGFDVTGRMYFISGDLQTFSRVGDIFESVEVGDAPLGGAGAAMYAPGKIVVFGGGKLDHTLIIDVNGSDPVITSLAPTAARRDLVNATILADGTVLATGGSELYNARAGATNTAEIWNPETGTWRVGPAAALERLYHSTALLLADASVLVAGGGANGPLTNLNAEIYYPPYLIDAAGRFAARPSIRSAPARIAAGTAFDVSLSADETIARVTLIKTGSVTHSWNMDQRFVPVTFTQSGATLSVGPPENANLMTPGYYLLFVFNAAGVPSHARIVQVAPPAA
jgi:hypothetical protein